MSWLSGICDRCLRKTMSSTGSMFTDEQICLDCATKERAHPRYEEARSAEAAAVRAGDYNFPGIGLPEDLR